MSIARGDYYKGKNKFLFCPLCGRLFVLRGGFPSSASIQPTGNDVLYCVLHSPTLSYEIYYSLQLRPPPQQCGAFLLTGGGYNVIGVNTYNPIAKSQRVKKF